MPRAPAEPDTRTVPVSLADLQMLAGDLKFCLRSVIGIVNAMEAADASMSPPVFGGNFLGIDEKKEAIKGTKGLTKIIGRLHGLARQEWGQKAEDYRGWNEE